jgi:predicted Zn-dependent protease
MLFTRTRRPPERLATRFRWLEPKPFPTVTAPSYSAGYGKGGYVLTLEKESLFAWEAPREDLPLSDFILEADVEIDPSNGHSAAGVLFRRVDDENFYSFLLSSRGNFRVDLLFNNHPLRLIEWTRTPEPDPERHHGNAAGRPGGGSRLIRVIGHGSRFSFQIDDEWVAELEDEMLPAGGIGFAAQSFAGGGRGVFHLRRLLLDTRPVEVERGHLAGWYYAPVSPASRMRLAETLFTSGSFEAAAVQMRKGLAGREGTARERFLLAQCYMRLSLNAEALAEVDRVLALEPAHAEARLEKANILYLTGRLLEARDALLSGLEERRIPEDPGVWNLLGNAEYGLGNWEKAVEAYRRAVALQPDMPLFLMNAARALEHAGGAAEATGLYLAAARRFFDEEAFDDLSAVIPRLRALAPECPEALAMEAKMLYQEGRADEAFDLLARLEARGTEDSAVHYLMGIILCARGGRAEALPRLARAAELEPDFPLYQFRLAENLHALGRDPTAALERALSIAPSDPWANNLAGQISLEAGDPEAAVRRLRVARAAAPRERDIAVNLSEALSLAGSHGEALAVIRDFGDSPSEPAAERARMANQRGNIHARQGDRTAAVAEYETAIRLDPSNPDYPVNCAAACIGLDMVHRAEELLAQVEPAHPSAEIYNLLGQVAALKGERARAELAYGQGLALSPGDPDITMNLVQLHRERGNHDAARDLLVSLLEARPHDARARSALERLHDERDVRISCAACGRAWWAPKSLPPQPGIRVRGEPPAEAPAGLCPRCGKVYCVGCASAHLRDMRFHCPDCDVPLKLSTDALNWLLARAIEGPQRPPADGRLDKR